MGVVTMKMISRTSITSTMGVTLISDSRRRSPEREGSDMAMDGPTPGRGGRGG
jgi:hypothetical protein